jgi:hypothetical protein
MKQQPSAFSLSRPLLDPKARLENGGNHNSIKHIRAQAHAEADD